MNVAQKNAMLSFFGPLIVMAGLIYSVLCLYLFLMQSKILFYPNLPGRKLTTSPADIGLEYESVSIVTKDKVQIHGWFVHSGRKRGTILFMHGNAGNISHRLDSLQIFNHLGFSTFIIDYRGYGQSEGKITEEGTYLDAEAAWQYLTETRGIDPREIIVFGRSLGGAIASNLASKKQPGGLILESVFTSVPDMAAKLYPVFPVRLLCRYTYDTNAAIQSVSSPVLIVHSPDDEIIPFENGLELFSSAKEPKTFLKIRGGHNDGFIASGPLYYEGLDSFVTKCLKTTPEETH